MKWAAGITGILGAFAGFFLGIKWFSDLNSELGQLAMAMSAAAGEAGAQLGSMKSATYSLLGCGLVGLVVSILILMRKGNRWANAALLTVAGILPLVFATNALFGVPMTLAGLFALAVNYEPARTPATV